MLNSQELGLMALVRSALTQRKVDLPEGFSLTKLLGVIKKHQIAPIILQALSYYDLPDQLACTQQMLTTGGMSLAIFESQRLEMQALCAAFEQAQIDYAPLKGYLICELYPQASMRSMADVDILIRKKDYGRIEKIMLQLGYTREVESDHEYNWRKGYVHMELHKSLVPSYDRGYYAYYGEGWEKFRRKAEDSFCHEMSKEDQFVYLFTHYAKHFRDGGIGVKHLTDLWVCRNENLDRSYILRELKKLRLDEFYLNVEQAIDVWFEDAPLMEKAEIILHSIIAGAAYGMKDAQNKAEALRNAPDGKGSKLRWTMRKIFLPYKNMCIKYPFLRYVPFLLPIMWVVRWITALVCKPKKLKHDVEEMRNMSQESLDEYQAYMASVGLHFDAKE